ncbi:MAG TPA: hypothetical protein VN603_00870 [Candidatus Acidoferrales bacterium]|nr:hypothetical protein [Candidatus Acidoferrales bacterium]
MPKCTTFSFRDDLTEMVPDALYMRSVVGERLSIGVVKFIEPEAKKLPLKEHAHGEEVTLQIDGGCTVFQGVVGQPPSHQVELESGTVMVIPADEPHYGINTYGASHVSMRLNVATPPRADYGTKGAERVFYHALEEGKR